MNLDRFELRKLDPQQLFHRIIAEPLSMVKNKKRYVVIIDAMNECYKNFREQIIRIVRGLWVENTPDWLGVIVSASTGTYAIRKLTKSNAATRLVFDEYDNMKDAEIIFRDQLRARKVADVHKGAKILAEKTEGEMLYTRFTMLVLDIKGDYSENALTDLPKSTVELLKPYFSHLSKEIEDFKEIIAPLAVARAPLPLKVWRELSDYGEDAPEFNDDIKSKMKPLIYDHLGATRLIHNSIAYMLRDSQDEAVKIDLQSAHRKLATWCWERKEKHPFAKSHVIFHLCEAGRFEDARKLLLNFDWNMKRVSLKQQFEKASNVERALNDAFNVYLRRRPDDREVAIVQTALDLGRAAISYDHRQMASQLLGRIGKDQTSLSDLLNAARDYNPGGKHWWQPVYPSLKRADSSLRTVLSQYAGTVTAVALAPQGNKMATASQDGLVKIYETLRGKSLFTFEEHRQNDGSVQSVCFSYHSDVLLASCATDNTVKIWNVRKGEKQGEVKHNKIISAIHFGGKEIVRLKPEDRKRNIAVNLLLTGSVDKKIQIYNVMTLERLQIIDHDFAITALKFSPLDVDQCAVAGKNGLISIYNWKKKTMLQSLVEHSSSCNALAYHPERNLLLSVSSDTQQSGGQNCILWDLSADTGEEKVRSYDLHDTSIQSCGFSADGNHFITAGDDKVICIAQLDPDGEYATLTERSDEREIRRQKMEEEKEKRKKVLKENNAQQRILHKDATMIFAASHEKQILSVCFFPKGHKFASCGRDNTLKIWSYDPLDQLKAERHSKPVISAAFSPNGKLICTAGIDRKVIVWDVTTGDPLVTTVLTKPTQKIYFSEDSKHIALEQTPNNFILSLSSEADGKGKRHKLIESKDRTFQDARFKNKDVPNRNGERIRAKSYGITRYKPDAVDFTIDSNWVEDETSALALGIPGMKAMLEEDENRDDVYACMCVGERVHILHLRSPHSEDKQKQVEEEKVRQEEEDKKKEVEKEKEEQGEDEEQGETEE